MDSFPAPERKLYIGHFKPVLWSYLFHSFHFATEPLPWHPVRRIQNLQSVVIESANGKLPRIRDRTSLITCKKIESKKERPVSNRTI